MEVRRIESREETERKHKRNVNFISIAMLILLLGSTVGFALIYSDEDSEGESQDDSELTLPFGTSIENAKLVPVNIQKNINSYSGKNVYISANESGVVNVIGSIMGQYASRVNEACYEKCEKDLPEKNCSENLIVYTEKEENNVYQTENCIFIEGELRAIDAFLYRLVGGN